MGKSAVPHLTHVFSFARPFLARWDPAHRAAGPGATSTRARLHLTCSAICLAPDLSGALPRAPAGAEGPCTPCVWPLRPGLTGGGSSDHHASTVSRAASNSPPGKNKSPGGSGAAQRTRGLKTFLFFFAAPASPLSPGSHPRKGKMHGPQRAKARPALAGTPGLARLRRRRQARPKNARVGGGVPLSPLSRRSQF